MYAPKKVIACNQERTGAERKGWLTSWKRRIFCVSGRVTVSPSSCWRKGSAGLNWLSNSHRRPFTQTALSYFSWNMNRWSEGQLVGGENAITAAFSYVISVVLLCRNTSPRFKLILYNRHRCPGSYYLNRPRTSKAVNITGYYSLFLLIFNKTSSLHGLSGGRWGRFTSRSPVVPNLLFHMCFSLRLGLKESNKANRQPSH